MNTKMRQELSYHTQQLTIAYLRVCVKKRGNCLFFFGSVERLPTMSHTQLVLGLEPFCGGKRLQRVGAMMRRTCREDTGRDVQGLTLLWTCSKMLKRRQKFRLYFDFCATQEPNSARLGSFWIDKLVLSIFISTKPWTLIERESISAST